MPKYTVEEEIELLVDAGLLTEREAEVYVLRSVEGTPGYAVADELDISEQRVSDAKRQAEDKVESARETLEALGEIRYQIPDEHSMPAPDADGVQRLIEADRDADASE